MAIQDSSPSVPVKRYHLVSGWNPLEIHAIREASVTLSVNGQEWLSFACTPLDLPALAAGFLYNEAVIQTRDDIAILDVCKAGTCIDVWLHHSVDRPASWLRTSGCVGGFTAGPGSQPFQPRSARFSPRALLDGMDLLLKSQEMYRESGGLHCSAISDGKTNSARVEDIGRHNTLDKLAGLLILNNLQINPLLLLTTGRVSLDMMQKAVRMGADAVVTRKSPTDQAIRLADAAGILLAGQARHEQILIYTHAERLDSE